MFGVVSSDERGCWGSRLHDQLTASVEGAHSTPVLPECPGVPALHPILTMTPTPKRVAGEEDRWAFQRLSLGLGNHCHSLSALALRNTSSQVAQGWYTQPYPPCCCSWNRCQQPPGILVSTRHHGSNWPPCVFPAVPPGRPLLTLEIACAQQQAPGEQQQPDGGSRELLPLQQQEVAAAAAGGDGGGNGEPQAPSASKRRKVVDGDGGTAAEADTSPTEHWTAASSRGPGVREAGVMISPVAVPPPLLMMRAPLPPLPCWRPSRPTASSWPTPARGLISARGHRTSRGTAPRCCGWR